MARGCHAGCQPHQDQHRAFIQSLFNDDSMPIPESVALSHTDASQEWVVSLVDGPLLSVILWNYNYECCSSCLNTCLSPLSHYIHITDDYLSKISLWLRWVIISSPGSSPTCGLLLHVFSHSLSSVQLFSVSPCWWDIRQCRLSAKIWWKNFLELAYNCLSNVSIFSNSCTPTSGKYHLWVLAHPLIL